MHYAICARCLVFAINEDGLLFLYKLADFYPTIISNTQKKYILCRIQNHEEKAWSVIEKIDKKI